MQPRCQGLSSLGDGKCKDPGNEVASSSTNPDYVSVLTRFSSHFVIYGIALITTEMFSRVDPCRG